MRPSSKDALLRVAGTFTRCDHGGQNAARIGQVRLTRLGQGDLLRAPTLQQAHAEVFLQRFDLTQGNWPLRFWRVAISHLCPVGISESLVGHAKPTQLTLAVRLKN